MFGVVAGFVALAWYAYHAGTQSVKDEDLIVVEADKTPMKEKPVDPGGMQFPNQDKTIFDTFAGQRRSRRKSSACCRSRKSRWRRTTADSETTTWINDKSAKTMREALKAKPEQVIGAEEKNRRIRVAEATPPAAAAVTLPRAKRNRRVAPAPEPSSRIAEALQSLPRRHVADKKQPEAKKTALAPPAETRG